MHCSLDGRCERTEQGGVASWDEALLRGGQDLVLSRLGRTEHARVGWVSPVDLSTGASVIHLYHCRHLDDFAQPLQRAVEKLGMNESHTELKGRCHWSLALIAELVNTARGAGWLPGDPVPGVNSDVVLAAANANANASETPMQLMAARLGLTKVEVDLLWLLACIELDPHVGTAMQMLVPAAMNELSAQIIERLVGRGEPLVDDVFERLDRFALVHCDTRLPLNRRPVRLHQRVIDLARGQLRLDSALKAVASVEDALSVRRSAVGEREMPAELRAALAQNAHALFLATGIEGTGRATLFRQAISACGRGVLTIKSRDLSSDEGELAQQLRAIARECTIHDAWPLFIEVDALSAQLAVFNSKILAEIRVPVFCTATETCTWSTPRPIVSLPLTIGDACARESVWREALVAANESVISECAQRYAISPGVIVKAASAASALAGSTASVDVAHVHRALRTHLDQRLAGIARRIDTKQTWNDLVMPIDQFDLLIEMVARVRHKQRVLNEWGFADKVGRGLGLSALFSGPPGTGKTMVAGLIAQELGLDLFQVDLSKVVSKYIGETEKHLSALFEAAESGHAILLFDEADSLFAKRTEVKSSNDRYGNLEVNYLLQRIEAFSGITILTTNHETAIDHAFLRRLAFHVRVPMPDERHRELIWNSMLPAKAQRASDLDFAPLANEFVMSGGYIKNAVLRAAFLSAEEGSAITNEHLWRAARAEYEAMGKISFQPTRLVG